MRLRPLPTAILLLSLAPACGPELAPDAPALHADLAEGLPPELDGAAAHLRSGEWQKARADAGRALSADGDGGHLDIVIGAHTAAGRACAMLADEDCAAASYAAVTAAWADPASAVKRLEALGGDGEAQRKRLARAINSVGEAVFFSAEQRRREAEKLARPVYQGSGTRDEVLAFVNTTVKDWVGARRTAIDGAETAYQKVAQIQPVPPPRWVVAAAERVGGLWSGFVDDFRAAPMPTEWQGHGPVPGANGLTFEALRAEYQGKLVEASAPQLEQARAAYRTCRDYAAKFGIADEHARACDAWWAAHPTP
jgi:hypothetical protein